MNPLNLVIKLIKLLFQHISLFKEFAYLFT